MPARPTSFPFAASILAAAAGAQCATPWTSLAGGVDDTVHCLAVLPNGDLVAGGDFTTAGGVPANRIARWDGAAWWPFGAGADGSVRALLVLPNGELVAGGHFVSMDGTQVNYVARFDGQGWHALGGGTNQWVWALTTLPSGELVVGGLFTSAGGVAANHVATWNGAAWSPIGAGVPGAFVGALRVMPSGELIAGGLFSGIGASGIARWNGSAWLPLGGGLTGIGFLSATSLLVDPNDHLIAGGAFTVAGGVPANNVARWDGSAWWPLGNGVNGPVTALQWSPDGDLFAGGFIGGSLARWDGTAWSVFAGGADAAVRAIAAMPDGSRVFGGSFTIAGGAAFAHIAQVSTTCPAGAVVVGSGCTGSGGVNLLTAVTPPWLGHVTTARATGLADGALAVAVYGFDALSLPLASAHPLGAPGCLLLATDDVLVEVEVTAGTADTAIAIPSEPAIAGAVFRHQLVAVEVDANGAIAALTSSNALELTIGVY